MWVGLMWVETDVGCALACEHATHDQNLPKFNAGTRTCPPTCVIAPQNLVAPGAGARII